MENGLRSLWGKRGHGAATLPLAMAAVIALALMGVSHLPAVAGPSGTSTQATAPVHRLDLEIRRTDHPEFNYTEWIGANIYQKMAYGRQVVDAHSNICDHTSIAEGYQYDIRLTNKSVELAPGDSSTNPIIWADTTGLLDYNVRFTDSSGADIDKSMLASKKQNGYAAGPLQAGQSTVIHLTITKPLIDVHEGPRKVLLYAYWSNGAVKQACDAIEIDVYRR
jgi:hypothetical protein